MRRADLASHPMEKITAAVKPLIHRLRALEFASSNLPFMPKEAWQLSKMLYEISRAPRDKAFFEKLDQMRHAGNEAAH